MKKYLKFIFLVLTAVVMALALVACGGKVTLAKPDVTQLSNNVFQWGAADGADGYRMKLDDAESDIAVLPVQVTEAGVGVNVEASASGTSDGNSGSATAEGSGSADGSTVTYDAVRYTLDTSALTEGTHTVSFAAYKGGDVSEYSATFTVIVSAASLEAPSLSISGQTLSVKESAAAVYDVTFTGNGTSTTATWTKPAGETKIGIYTLLGETKLEDGATYLVTAVCKEGEAVSDVSNTVVYTYTASDGKLETPLGSIGYNGMPEFDLNGISGKVVVSFKFGSIEKTVSLSASRSLSIEQVMYELPADVQMELKTAYYTAGEDGVEVSLRIDYAESFPAHAASDWSEPVLFEAPDTAVTGIVSVSGSLASGTITVKQQAVDVADVVVTLNDAEVEGKASDATTAVYELPRVPGANHLVVTATMDGETFVLANEYEYIATKVSTLRVNGSKVSWTATKAEEYVVVVTAEGGAPVEYTVTRNSFDFSEVAQPVTDNGIAKFNVVVYGVFNDTRSEASTALTVYRMDAPGSVVCETQSNIELINGSDYTMAYSTSSGESGTVSLGYDHSFNKPSENLTISAHYQGDNEYLLNSLVSDYTFYTAGVLEYRVVDGDYVEIIGKDLHDIYVDGVLIDSDYIEDEKYFDIGAYIDEYSSSVSFSQAPVGYVLADSETALYRGVTVNYRSLKLATPRFATTTDNITDVLTWDVGEFGRYKYELSKGDETIEASTLENFTDDSGASFDFSTLTEAGTYTFRVRKLATGGEFNSDWATTTYTIWDAVPTSIDTTTSTSYNCFTFGSVYNADIEYVVYEDYNSDRSGTIYNSYSGTNRRVSLNANSSYSYTSVKITLVPATGYARAYSETVYLNRVHVAYYNTSDNYLDYYYIKQGETPETPDLERNGATVYAWSRTQSGSEITFETVRSAGTGYVAVTINGTQFSTSNLKNTNTGTAITTVIVAEGTDIAAYLAEWMPANSGYTWTVDGTTATVSAVS